MLQNQFFNSWPVASLYFGGGGAPQMTEAEKRKQHQMELAQKHQMASMSAGIKMPDIKIPDPPAPVTIPPPASQSSADVEDAQTEARKASAKKYGLMKTTYAGNTGGYGGFMGSPLGAGAGKSLLG